MHLKAHWIEGIDSIHQIRFYSNEGHEYHDLTPLSVITNDSFYIRVNHNECYFILNFKEDDSVYLQPQNITELAVDKLLTDFGSSPLKKDSLNDFVSEVIEDIILTKDDKGEIGINSFTSIIKKKFLKIRFARKKN